jgi:hypothetical protein
VAPRRFGSSAAVRQEYGFIVAATAVCPPVAEYERISHMHAPHPGQEHPIIVAAQAFNSGTASTHARFIAGGAF